MKNRDYQLGTIQHFGIWTDLRTMLGSVLGGCLTASCLHVGDDKWQVSVRSTRRLTKDEITWLNGWFDGFNHFCNPIRMAA